MSNGTMVSCLMVTRDVPSRLPLLQRSIRDFQRQTHPNRELIVIAEATEPAGFARVREALEGVPGDAPVRLVEVAPGPTLGALRNRSMDAAAGDLFCQWDDDDRHHPERIARQFAALEDGDNDAVFLRQIVHYFDRDRIAYVTTWAPTAFAGHPGTILVRRRAEPRYPEVGPYARRAEDSALHHDLSSRTSITVVDGMPYLFAYVQHGANTWERAHHARLAMGLSLSPALLTHRKAELMEGLSALALTSDALEIRAWNSVVFTLPAAPTIEGGLAP